MIEENLEVHGQSTGGTSGGEAGRRTDPVTKKVMS